MKNRQYTRLGSRTNWAIALGIAIAVALIVLIENDFSHAVHYINALTTAGGICVFVGLLVLVSYYGAFDIFGYAIKNPDYRRKITYLDYSAKKRNERDKSNCAPYLLVGAFCILTGLLGSWVIRLL